MDIMMSIVQIFATVFSEFVETHEIIRRYCFILLLEYIFHLSIYFYYWVVNRKDIVYNARQCKSRTELQFTVAPLKNTILPDFMSTVIQTYSVKTSGK